MGEMVDALRELRRFAQAAAAKNRRKGEKLVAEIERRKRRIRREFWEIGRALLQLAEPAIYTAMGFASYAALVQKRRLFTRSQAQRLMEVAKTFTREQALSLGAEKAFAVARYVAATPEEDVAGELVDADVAIGGKPLSALSVREIAAATKAVRVKSRSVDPLEKDAKKAARAVQAGLRKRGAPRAVANALRREGGWFVRVELPIEDVRIIGG